MCSSKSDIPLCNKFLDRTPTEERGKMEPEVPCGAMRPTLIEERHEQGQDEVCASVP